MNSSAVAGQEKLPARKNGYARGWKRRKRISVLEWQADDVYKAGRLRDYYGVFRNKVNGTDDVEELQRYFKDIVRYQQERLLANPPARNSTSPMANMAHTLRLECVQQLVEDYGHFIRILADTLRQQETRRDTRTLREKENRRGPKL